MTDASDRSDFVCPDHDRHCVWAGGPYRWCPAGGTKDSGHFWHRRSYVLSYTNSDERVNPAGGTYNDIQRSTEPPRVWQP